METSLNTGVLSLYVEFCLQAPGSCTNTHLIRQSYLSCWDIRGMGRLVAGTQNPAPNSALCRATYHPRRLSRRYMSRERPGKGAIQGSGSELQCWPLKSWAGPHESLPSTGLEAARAVAPKQSEQPLLSVPHAHT